MSFEKFLDKKQLLHRCVRGNFYCCEYLDSLENRTVYLFFDDKIECEDYEIVKCCPFCGYKPEVTDDLV